MFILSFAIKALWNNAEQSYAFITGFFRNRQIGFSEKKKGKSRFCFAYL
ncbi:hypothetical protein HYU19_03900 [Candidatus Woesearchaeota archaeon]|nr:hypothetical protein [Candidatus Woesearchaeota archaeon]